MDEFDFSRPLAPAMPAPGRDGPVAEPIYRAMLQALGDLPLLAPHNWPPSRVTRLYLPVVNVAVNMNPAATTTLATFPVPGGMYGRLTRFGNAGSDLGNLRWNLLIQGSAADPIAGLVGPYGSLSAPLALDAGGIPVAPNNLIELSVVNLGLGVITGVQAVLLGWLVSAADLATRRPRW
jgi:hypothetical protein